jgi:hypothetical protein
MALYETPNPVVGKVCDHGSCPAPAEHAVWLLDQDFYFCGHHGRELWIAVARESLRGAAVDRDEALDARGLLIGH